jgi:hypothetical protein
MTLRQKVYSVFGTALAVALFAFLVKIESPSPSLGQVYGVSAFSVTSTATQATTTLYAFGGILHTVTITKPVSNSVITICDSATSSSCAVAPIVITIPSSSTQVPLTLTFDARFFNGLTIVQSGATSTLSPTYQQN